MTRAAAMELVARDIAATAGLLDDVSTEQLFVFYQLGVKQIQDQQISVSDIFCLCVYGQHLLARALEFGKSPQDIPENATDPEAISL